MHRVCQGERHGFRVPLPEARRTFFADRVLTRSFGASKSAPGVDFAVQPRPFGLRKQVGVASACRPSKPSEPPITAAEIVS